MKRKLVITKIPSYLNKVFSIVIENDDIVEIHCNEEEDNVLGLGNMYVGKVKNIVPNIEAAFIEVSKGVECYYSLAQNKNPIFTTKIGKSPLSVGDELLVQVSKEAVKTKAPTVTSNLEIAGKYVVLTAGNSHIGTSTKLPQDLRIELQELMKNYRCEAYGFIIRTNAKDVTTAVILAEVEKLKTEYETMIHIAKTRTCYSCLKELPKPYLLYLRDIYKEGLSDIIIEDSNLFEEVYEFLGKDQPETLHILKEYKDNLLPLHKLYSVETNLESALKEKVWMKSGAYLVIQPTEALTVIDVNTGKYVKKKIDDHMYLKINIEAAVESAKQIRLRNLSGIIIVDFINMEESYMVDELLNIFEKHLKRDQVPTNLVDMTKLQLVEVTRKKIRKTLKESLK